MDDFPDTLSVNQIFARCAQSWPPERIAAETGRPGSLVWRWDDEYDAYKIGLALDVRGAYDGLPKFLYSRMPGPELTAMAQLGNVAGVAQKIHLKITALLDYARGQTQHELARDVFEGEPPQLEA